MPVVRGFVRDEFGKPVENATIAVPSAYKFALSHQDGSFEVELPKGIYTMHIVQRFYHRSSYKIDVYADTILQGIVLRTLTGTPIAEPLIGGAVNEMSALEAKKDIEDTLLEIPGVVGVGLERNLRRIRVYVTRCEQTIADERIPRQISGFDVEVMCVGRVAPLAEAVVRQDTIGETYRARRYRPAVGGISAAHRDVEAGTIGAVVRDRSTREKLLLSCNHVFANKDMVGYSRAAQGDPVTQPGHWDLSRVVNMGVSDNEIGSLMRWVPLDPNGDNIVDAAVVIPFAQDIVREYILSDDSYDVIRVNGASSVKRGIPVKKYGRTTDFKRGKVIDWDATVMVVYGGIPVKFVDQLLIEMDAEKGDSGALILDDNNTAVGLMFSGSVNVRPDGSTVKYCYANKISNVLSMLDIYLGGTDEKPKWAK